MSPELTAAELAEYTAYMAENAARIDAQIAQQAADCGWTVDELLSAIASGEVVS